MRCYLSIGLVAACALIGSANLHGEDLRLSMFGDAPAVSDEAPLSVSIFGECDPFQEVRAPLRIAMFVDQRIEPIEAQRPRARQLLVFKSASCGEPCSDLETQTLAPLRKAGWNIADTESVPIRIVLIEEHPDLAKRYAIEAVPTFVMLNFGFEVERHVGLIDRWAVSRIYNGENRRALAHR
jgi:hypothetical protein